MTAYYNALSGIVTAANDAMDGIARDRSFEDAEEVRSERIRQTWEPVANALLDAEPDFADWPELKQQAEQCGGDYVGVTSDTRQVVCWGEEVAASQGLTYRRFVLLDRPAQ